MKNNNYSSDIPVSLEKEDRFSRWTFSERIAEVISKRSDPGCITVGLYGAWGDGKTSVLNFIEESLKKNDNVIFIKFNPWRFTTEEALLSGFFFKIADALDAELIKTGDKLKEIIKKSAPGLGAAAGVKGIGDSISSFIGGPNIEELKTRIESELEKAKKRVLIVIDDVDRLEKSEIQSLFKLIKLTADFRYTAYILSFDKEIVSSSLQDRYSGSDTNSGEAFLEKIIQVPLHLPKVERKVLRDFCFQGVEEALRLSEIELTEQQVQEFVRDFTNAFDDCLATPRRAKLYGNTLMFSLPILKNEVNPVDFMLIEGIRIFCPALYDVIRSNKELFTGLLRDSSNVNNDHEKIKIQTIIEESLIKGRILETSGYINVLKNLFPKLESVYGNMCYGSDFYEIWNKGQRVCSENYFNRYFTYSIPRGDIGDIQILEIVVKLEEVDFESEEISNTLFSEFIDPENAESIIKKLRQKADSFTPNQSISLSKAICLECNKYPNPEALYNWTVPFIQASILVSSLIQNLHENKREELAVSCINISPSVEFKLELFRWLRKKDEEKPEKEGFSDEQVNRIGVVLGDNLSSYLETADDITKSISRSVPNMLYAIKKYTGQDFLSNYLDKEFEKDKAYVIRLLDAYTSTAWGMDTGISHKSDFERRQYNNLVDEIDPNRIVKAIIEYFGCPQEIDDEFPRNDDEEDRTVILKQFLWIHRFVNTEKRKSRDIN